MRSAGVHEVLSGWTAGDHEAAAPHLTYLQQARGLAFTGSCLELLDLDPVTVCVLPAPAGALGHMTTGAFLDLWWAVAERVAAGATRRAVVALVAPGSLGAYDALVLVGRPRIHGSGLRYDAELVEGVLPASSGSCLLVVHPAAAPTPAATA